MQRLKSWLLHPAFGCLDTGRHWVDGTSICKLGRVRLPEQARARLELGEAGESAPSSTAPAGSNAQSSEEPGVFAIRSLSYATDSEVVPTSRPEGSPVELYRLRPDFDVRIEAAAPGKEMRLPAGDYAAFQDNAGGAPRIERFTAKPGEVTTIRAGRR